MSGVTLTVFGLVVGVLALGCALIIVLLAEGWTPPPDPHEDIARELYDTAFAPARYADSRSVGPMLLAAVHRIPDDLARQVADALRGDDADG